MRLSGFQCPVQALVPDGTLPTHRLRPQGLAQRGTAASHRKEQVRVLVGAAGGESPRGRLGVLSRLGDTYLPGGGNAKRAHLLFLLHGWAAGTISLSQIHLVHLH